MVAIHVGDAGAGIARSSAGYIDPQQWGEGVVRVAERSEDRGDLQRVAGCGGSGGADTIRARVSIGGVGLGAVHSNGPLQAADGVESEAVGAAEGAGAGVLECEEGVGGAYPRFLYQGCGRPGVFTRSIYMDVLAVRNSVRRSGPPKAQLAQTSGISMMPILLPSGANTQTPPVPVQKTRPAWSTFMPSGTPLVPSADMSAKTRRRTMLPALSSSTAWMYCVQRVFAI